MNRFSFLPIALLVACGGADGSGLLGDSGNQDETSAGNDASVQADSPVVDAPTKDVATIEDVVTLDVKPDIHVGPADSKIQCGPSVTCSAQKETCCWHMGTTVNPYECVSSASDCAGTYDVPMTCSSADNCASQGNPSYTCCATGGNNGTGQCYGYDIATDVSCKASCTGTAQFEVGCSVKTQNCKDTLQMCIVSKCTVPGDTICN